MIEKIIFAKALASVACCAMGSYCMFITNGSTGVGWTILGIALIWGSTVNIYKGKK